ncbi:glutathione hydrolase 1 proenzyme [Trichomycterus rosablanca]|uniref:glutathione hydrolase 1 proenzyme n=1 Tax=Trichomycterus rosablanca TaxID=2290929 RepID=UPI002F351FFF
MVQKSVVFGLVVLLLAAVGTFVGVFFGTSGKKTPTVTETWYRRAAVAADAGPCSEIGRGVLVKGGSAVDAAIAGLLCVGLMNAHSAGIGGGLFLTIYNSTTGRVETIDARETAPSNASRDMFGNSTELSQRGGLAIAVPGEIRGYELAHQRHGRLKWRELFIPSIKLAREGFPVGNALAGAIYKNRNTIRRDPNMCSVFCNADGDILKENDTIKFLKLADTYEEIADKGSDVFYNGTIAEKLVTDIRGAGGIITTEDLSGYTPLLDENPLNASVGDMTMFVPNAPSSGPVLTLILNILNGYNFTADSVSDSQKRVLTYHRIVEVFKFAFAKRSMLGDPKFLNITEFIQNIMSKSYAESIRQKITDHTTHNESYYEPEYFIPDDHGTSHISVTDQDGNAIAATSTINHFFGSKVLSSSTGVLLNNEMDDFSSPLIVNGYGIPPSPNNYIQPYKRPMSSMCPTLLFDGNKEVKMVVGASGGTKITTSVAEVILNALFFKYDLKRSVSDPRVHHQLSPNYVVVEPNFDTDVIEGLKEKNHVIEVLESTGAVIQAIQRDGSRIYAQSDPRKGGYATGY